jgi:dTDP-4-amino-4,6-dideoxygalactose transaminase
VSADRAIGGVFAAAPEGAPVAGSVWAAWTAGWPHVAAYRTARSALAALLADRRPGRLLLPDYTCEAIWRHGAVAYPIGPDLQPDVDRLAALLRPGDAVVGVNYFGRSPSPAFRALAASRPDVLWIEDRAQALEPGAPAWGEVVIYSPRKLLGVADGGVMVSRSPLPQPAAGPDDDSLWAPEDARAGDPDGNEPQAWYPLFQRREAAFAVDAAPMSARTMKALRAAKIAPIVAARRANWRTLAGRLGEHALWPQLDPDFAPLAFPILVTDAAASVRALAEHRLWCPRHWADLPGAPGPAARALSERLVSLPCDQRYGEADMQRLADAVERL